MNIHSLIEKKRRSEKITMVTCYDYTMARIVDGSNVDLLLVGDSAAMVMHGYETTLNADLEMMCFHTQAVARGSRNKLIVADLPFLSFRKTLEYGMTAVEKIMQAGAHAVKLEGATGNLELVRHLVDSGVPVMGHLGLTPQSIFQLGGFKVQGREKETQDQMLKDALALEKAGCFSLVLECVPQELAKQITSHLTIPTIGIGAGVHTDGQVLVLQDMLGMNPEFKPKFLKHYLNGKELITKALNDYVVDVKERQFPAKEHSYE